MKTKIELQKLAVEKWNKDIPRLQKYLENIIERYGELSAKDVLDVQLIWQEILMYIMLGREVELEDYQIIIERRGFSEFISNYLKEMLIEIGIGNLLKTDPVIDAAEKKAQEVEQEYLANEKK